MYDVGIWKSVLGKNKVTHSFLDTAENHVLIIKTYVQVIQGGFCPPVQGFYVRSVLLGIWLVNYSSVNGQTERFY